MVYINTLEYTQGVITHNFGLMENSSSKKHRQIRSTRAFESKAKSVCSARKLSLRAQSGGTTKSRSSTEQVWSGKTVLNSNLKGRNISF